MLGTLPFAGISATGQSTAQGVTTSAAKLTIPNATATPNTGSRIGDPAVKADPSNSRLILNGPGLYRVTLEGAGSAASALQTTFAFRKGVSTFTEITGTRQKVTWATTPSGFSLTAIVEITPSDIPAAGGVSTFADPDATAGAGKPAGGFAGAGAAPKTGIYLDAQVTGNGSVNLTLTDIRLTAERVG